MLGHTLAPSPHPSPPLPRLATAGLPRGPGGAAGGADGPAAARLPRAGVGGRGRRRALARARVPVPQGAASAQRQCMHGAKPRLLLEDWGMWGLPPCLRAPCACAASRLTRRLFPRHTHCRPRPGLCPRCSCAAASRRAPTSTAAGVSASSSSQRPTPPTWSASTSSRCAARLAGMQVHACNAICAPIRAPPARPSLTPSTHNRYPPPTPRRCRLPMSCARCWTGRAPSPRSPGARGGGDLERERSGLSSKQPLY